MQSQAYGPAATAVLNPQCQPVVVQKWQPGQVLTCTVGAQDCDT
jgi:hypothetical protein